MGKSRTLSQPPLFSSVAIFASATSSRTTQLPLTSTATMGGNTRSNAAIQAYFPPTPTPSPTKTGASSPPLSSDAPVGDGFTPEEVEDALKPPPIQPWSPPSEYAEREIRDMYPGPGAVTFMGRVANLFDVGTTQKTPRSAQGCLKLCVKDGGGAVTVGLL